MHIEVELKAWVEDAAHLRGWLDSHARFTRTYDKSDLYYGRRPDDRETLFRLRLDGARAICTHKDKHIRAGIEENGEIEFGVEDADAFDRFALALGYVHLIRKRKVGRAYSIDDCTVELSEVDSLGHFVEIERLVAPEPPTTDAVPSDRSARVVATRAVLLNLLDRMGIARECIEPRTYTQLLFEHHSQVRESATT